MDSIKPETALPSEPQVRSNELVSLRQTLEDLSKQSRDKMDEHVAIAEYGKAEYYSGQEHAFAIASLRVKSLIQQANESSSPVPGQKRHECN